MNAEYDALLARARRNFALCVLQIQGSSCPAGISPSAWWQRWRAKADALKVAIDTAELLDLTGQRSAACELLRKENEPT
jgi:hypothetical protein